ncbi:MAG: DUF3179 domain-containing protein [bacterium]
MLRRVQLAAIYVFLSTSTFFWSCSSSSGDNFGTDPTQDNNSVWNINKNEIISGGVPKDGIPSLFNPKTIQADQASFLGDENLIVGIVVNGEPRAYPYTIADWHEVINEDFPGTLLTVSYCPLTGSSLVVNGNVASRNLKFGVSGLLYRNNLIMFDRQTDSHWPQMRLQCDEGELINTRQKLYPAIETSWGTWKKLYPNTVVLSTDTGFNRPYDVPGSAYPGYTNLNSSPGFRIPNLDRRLPPKQRVHGILVGPGPDDYESKAYPIRPNDETEIINNVIDGTPVVVVSDGKDNFIISFLRTIDNMTLSFKLSGNPDTFPFTFTDNETNSTWNVLGEAIDGPLAGKKLDRTLSFNAYWFAWAAFYPGAAIHGQ